MGVYSSIITIKNKIFNRLSAKKNLFWKFCDIDHISLCGYIQDDASFLKEKMQALLGIYDTRFFLRISDEEKQEIVILADQVLRHEFDLLGSGPVHVDPIDWHTDFKCGAKWEKSFYRELRTPRGADIKVPWELSRCQHLLWLGEAYLITNEAKYAKEIVDEINWWIDDNPLMYSVNWKCAMDVAFRAVNWMYALNMIVHCGDFNDEFAIKVSKSFWQHGFFIRNNLERQIPYSNNHYASDIVGLLYIGALFNHTSKGRRWFRFALKDYYKEVLTQVLPSGVHYERSVSYHRLMTELFSYPFYMLKRLGEDVPPKVVDRVGKMYDYVATYTKPNGLAPLIADNDDGRFVPFQKRDFRRHDYLNDPSSVENSFVATGMTPLFCSSFQGGQYIPDAGVSIIKQDDNYVFVNLGGYSKHPKETDVSIGTHTHNDLLSFELCLDGEDVLVDAGTYLYTSSKEDRDSFRSTVKHNTVVVDGEEQNGMVGAFVLKRNVHKRELKQISESAYEGEYCTIEGKMNHKRRFDFKEGQLIIIDTISKAGTSHEAKLYFHFAPGLAPVIPDDEIVVEGKARISFSKKATQMVVIDDKISPSFGVLDDSSTGIVTFVFDERLVLKTMINSIA